MTVFEAQIMLLNFLKKASNAQPSCPQSYTAFFKITGFSCSSGNSIFFDWPIQTVCAKTLIFFLASTHNVLFPIGLIRAFQNKNLGKFQPQRSHKKGS